MSTRERLTLAAALAVALGSAAIAPLYSDLQWLPRALGAIAAIAVLGLVCRRLSVPAVLQPLLALAVLFEYVAAVFVHSTLSYEFLPSGETIPALRSLLDEGLTDIERLAPPVPTHPGLMLIAVLGIGAVAIAVDVVAVLLGRAALAGLPLLVLFAVPSAVRPGGLGWLPFTLGAAGWLSLLLVEGSDRVGRWGTPLKAPKPVRGGPVYEDTSLGRVGRRIGAAALGVAIVVPAMIPGLNGRMLGVGSGDGPGNGGSRTTTTYNPLTRLSSELRLPTPRLILTYRTDDERPDYLRLTTLDRFSDEGWSASRLTGSPKDDGVKDRLPQPVGLTAAATVPVRTSISIKTLDAQWLPAPFPPREVNVEGPWLYDARSETIFGIRIGTKKLKDSYSVEADRVLPDRQLLAAADDPRLPESIQPYAVAPQVTDFVRELTNRVLAGQVSPYDRVTALQAFFQEPAQGFTYDTSSSVPGINSPSALENFLRGKQGFCEQYASAMAAMIRIAGVPARVAVGFTPGAKQDDGSYAVTTSNAHAWPEAWFEGTGWIRFEPTPRSDGQTVVPEYALPATDDGAVGPEGDPLAPGAGAAGEDPGDIGSLQSKLDDIDGIDPTAGLDLPSQEIAADGGSAGPSVWVIAVWLVAALLLLPWLVHTLRLRRRRSDPSPLLAWQQLHDDAVDVGHRWRPADSPRAAAAHLTAQRQLPEPAAAALDRLAAATEQARYARAGSPGSDGLHADAALVRAALLAGAAPRVRWQARLLPTSTLRWMSSVSGTFVADVLDRVDDAWAAVRRRLRLPGARAA